MIKKLSLLSLFTLMPASFYYAQTTVFAYVKDSQGKPVENADVNLGALSYEVSTDKIGYFQFVDVKPGHYEITVTKTPFDEQTLTFDVSADQRRKDLGVVTLSVNTNTVDQGFLTINDDDDADAQNNVTTVGLLHASRDVFSSIAGFNLGEYWFRPRGIDSRLGDYMLNGINMTRPDTGFVDYSTWGGLNTIVQYPDIALNSAPSEYLFGGVGNVFYKNMKASEYRKGSQLMYSVTNKNYRDRLSYRYTSGMSKKGWAYTVMAARRWAREGVQDGTFYDAYSGYLGVEKRFNSKHSMDLNIYGSPYRRSGASPETQEVFDLMGPHYNSYWGFQNGRKRSERIRKGFVPVIQLSDYWTINKNSQLWTTLSYQFGKEKASRLDWFNANNPSPLYYKNLPSYWEGIANPNATQLDNLQLTKQWWADRDPEHTQINWDYLYQANFGAEPDANGKRPAAYYLVNDEKNNRIWNFSAHYLNYLNSKTKLLVNLSYRNYYSEQYREIADLLGADYALNLDPFGNVADGRNFNTRDPDIQKKVGDKLGYDYIYRRQDYNLNVGLKLSTGSFDTFFSALGGYSKNNRQGLFEHYLYPDSFGRSPDEKFWSFGLKGQVTYKMSGRLFLVYNGAYYSQAPFLNDIYVNARNNAAVSPNIKSTLVNSNDLSFIIASPKIKLRITGYVINTSRDTDVQHFFGTGVNLTTMDAEGQEVTGDNAAMLTQVLSDVKKRYIGVEVGAQVKLSPTFTASGMASVGQYTYGNNPDLYFATDAIGIFHDLGPNGQLIASPYKNFGTAYLKDYKVGGTPQQAYSVELRYFNPRSWWVNGSWNYLGENYLDPAPAIRTQNFYINPNTDVPFDDISESELKRVLSPTKLPDGFFFNASIGKSWRLGKYYVSLTATVNNILNRKKYITGGFEQTRNLTYDTFVQDYDRTYPNFAPKYFYLQGRSYFANLNFSF